MKDPDWEKAEIDPAMIRVYLLSPTHPVGRFKAPFFAALGYTQKEWHALQADLREIIRQGQAVHAGRNDTARNTQFWQGSKHQATFRVISLQFG